MPSNTFNHLDLCSGIGGFALGFERAGMTTIGFCEIEEFAQLVLKKHWPHVPIYTDIKKLKGDEIGAVDIISAGFPCQPFSVAGKQRGKKDHRHLWPEVLRIIKETRPAWFVGENVYGFIRMALDDVLFDLEAEGYAAQPFVVPACAVGGIHRRDRVWIVAHAEHDGPSAGAQPGSKGSAICGAPQGQDEAEQPARVCTAAHVADRCGQRLERPPRHGADPTGRQTPGRPAGASGFLRDWEPAGLPTRSPICRADDGIPDRVARIKALGNAVMPQIPELLARAILAAEGFTT